MEYGKPFLLSIFPFNDLHGYLVENPIQTLIIRRHIVFLVWFIKRAWAACDFWCFARAENEKRDKNEIWGWGRGRKETLADKPQDFENLCSPANEARDWLG